MWGRVESLCHAALEVLRMRMAGDDVEEADPSSGEEDQFTEVETPRDSSLDPPEYSADNTDGDDGVLPDYEHGEQSSLREKGDGEAGDSATNGHRRETVNGRLSNEKMQRELDSVYDAIERLYTVAPRLQDQRVEMKPCTSKEGRRQAEIAREREKMKELEKIWGLIERTHRGRRTERQRADMWSDMEDGGSSAHHCQSTLITRRYTERS